MRKHSAYFIGGSYFNTKHVLKLVLGRKFTIESFSLYDGAESNPNSNLSSGF